MKIGLISDTHGYLHPRVLYHFKDCDEIWHGGDIGSFSLLQKLAHFKPLRAVFGNVDGAEVRKETKENLFFLSEGVSVLITHIAGYPGKYNPRVRALIKQYRPKIVICGHSHILKVIYDKKLEHLHINPGAAGNHGWHQVMTIITFEINKANRSKDELIACPEFNSGNTIKNNNSVSNIENLKVIELGARGLIESRG